MGKKIDTRLRSGLLPTFLVLLLLLVLSGCGGSGTSTQAAVSRQALWEPPSVVTIYFAGTGMTGEKWQVNSSASWDRELVASLHKWQQTSDIHMKWFVDGIGTGCSEVLNLFEVFDLANQAFPGLGLCRAP